MSKQIKIGFDKVPAPKITKPETLFDISGVPLRTESGEILYTEEKGALPQFFSADKSTSLVLSQDEITSVVEQFAETSQVSSSLLGIPREEQQLSLFSDVSTYGFDSNTWEFITEPGPIKQPAGWLSRKNKTYGARIPQPIVEEITDEQAIALKSFPVPYLFPHGPEFEDQGLYNEAVYIQYVKFFELGKLLYDTYSEYDENEEYEIFAKDNFLSNIGTIENGQVIYDQNKTNDEIFEELEKWTLAWIKLRNGTLFFPDNIKVNFPNGFDSTNTRPGYASNKRYYSQIESRKAFRYQPGRISGFTFGLKSSSDQASLDNIIEWGCSNDTDEYMFQVKGPNFSIIRRSTIPLPEQNLIDMGLTADDQILVPPLNPFKLGKFNPDTGLNEPVQQLYQITIPKELFNKDTLDGNGPSGYNLTVEQVTMYKIEFSWYGAIGAKFYAYVPSGNGEARWVLIHTLVIENKIGEPCLNDPYFKFKYVILITETSNLVKPQFVYKYGASYYIDGGDQGTLINYSATSETIQASPSNTRSALGLYSKDFILNKDGVAIKNKKEIYPESLLVTTDKPVKVDIIDCKGCPGFGHHYAPSLHNGQTGIVGNFTFSGDGTFIEYSNSASFTSNDINKKIIGDGIYSTYISRLSENLSRALIKRRVRPTTIFSPEASETYTYSNTDKVVLNNGASANVKSETFSLRLTGFDSIAASPLKLTKPNININFLNPERLENNNKTFSEFYIGVTDKEPSINLLTDELVFDNVLYDANNVLYGEWTNFRLEQNINGYDVFESDERYGTAMQIDPQIDIISGNPLGNDTGNCSKLSVRVTPFSLDCVFSSTKPGTTDGGNYLTFSPSSTILNSLTGLNGGEIGVESGGNIIGSGVTFLQDKAVFSTLANVFYIEVSSNSISSATKIYFNVVRIYGRYINTTKVFSFDVYPLYVVVGMRDNARINNITIDEYDNISKFSYTPNWLKSDDSSISIVNSGSVNEGLDPNTGNFISGGLSSEGEPSANFIETNRTSSSLIDRQLQQPLRPGEIRSSFYVDENEVKEFKLDHIFAQDRYSITPGSFNSKATFFTIKALDEQSNTQIILNYKEN